jgi:hypothetical protein
MEIVYALIQRQGTISSGEDEAGVIAFCPRPSISARVITVLMSLRGVNDVNVFNTHKFVDIVRKEDYVWISRIRR